MATETDRNACSLSCIEEEKVSGFSSLNCPTPSVPNSRRERTTERQRERKRAREKSGRSSIRAEEKRRERGEIARKRVEFNPPSSLFRLSERRKSAVTELEAGKRRDLLEVRPVRPRAMLDSVLVSVLVFFRFELRADLRLADFPGFQRERENVARERTVGQKGRERVGGRGDR